MVSGSAWAVPAVVVASAAPAFAASSPVTVLFTGRACISPGSPKLILFELSVSNSNNVPMTLNAVSLVVNNVTSTTICPTSGTIPSNSTAIVTIIAGLYTSEVGTALFNYTVGQIGGPYVPGQTSSEFINLPPIANPACPLANPAGCLPQRRD